MGALIAPTLLSLCIVVLCMAGASARQLEGNTNSDPASKLSHFQEIPRIRDATAVAQEIAVLMENVGPSAAEALVVEAPMADSVVPQCEPHNFCCCRKLPHLVDWEIRVLVAVPTAADINCSPGYVCCCSKA